MLQCWQSSPDLLVLYEAPLQKCVTDIARGKAPRDNSCHSSTFLLLYYVVPRSDDDAKGKLVVLLRGGLTWTKRLVVVVVVGKNRQIGMRHTTNGGAVVVSVAHDVVPCSLSRMRRSSILLACLFAKNAGACVPVLGWCRRSLLLCQRRLVLHADD